MEGDKIGNVQMGPTYENNMEPGIFARKVIAASGAGTITAHKIDSRLQRKAADNPHAKYNFSAKLKDPTSKGEEYIMFIGVSFDSAQLMSFELGELGEIEMDFTFDDYKYLKSIN